MEYHVVQPEVIVGLGDGTKIDNSNHPPTIENLHIELEDWLGDDLMEIFPCYIATESLIEGLKKSKFTGYEFLKILMSKSEYFQNNYSLSKALPPFYWLRIIGRSGYDDFYLTDDLRLSVSENALYYLQKNFSMNYFIVDSEENFDDLFVGL